MALPALLALVTLGFVDYQHDRRLGSERTQRNFVQVGEVLLAAMDHSIHLHDSEMMSGMLADAVRAGVAGRVQLINAQGQIKADSQKTAIGMTQSRDAAGCVECHGAGEGLVRNAVQLGSTGQMLRVAVPVKNDPECTGCHTNDGAELGVLLADISMAPVQAHLERELVQALAIAFGAALLVIAAMFLLVQWQVVRRVQAFHQPLLTYADGDLSARLPVPRRTEDELDQLSYEFNRMADELEDHLREREERVALRHAAIAEERERLARELHDGMAQVLGYVNTKAMATRLLVRKGKLDAAETNLLQLEQAARGLLVDVREAVLGLRLTGRGEGGLPAMLGEFTEHYTQLTGLPVELQVEPGVNDVELPADVELQLVRIVQEALANVRKHAEATHVEISLGAADETLDMRITDDGRGFDPESAMQDETPHFGMQTLRERAEAIGAELTLDSCPGSGTCVIVRLPLVKG